MRLFLSWDYVFVYPVFHWEDIFWKMSIKGGSQKRYKWKGGGHIAKGVYNTGERLKPFAYYGTLINKDGISQGGLIGFLCI